MLERQLNKTERYVNEISEHKDMEGGASCSKLRSEVKEFVEKYRKKVRVLDEKGRDMVDTNGRILVSGWGLRPCTQVFIYK